MSSPRKWVGLETLYGIQVDCELEDVTVRESIGRAFKEAPEEEVNSQS
jgi:hypothetical protein